MFTVFILVNSEQKQALIFFRTHLHKAFQVAHIVQILRLCASHDSLW